MGLAGYEPGPVGMLDVFVLRADTISTEGSASAGLDLAVGIPLVAIGALVATGRLHGRKKAAVPAGASWSSGRRAPRSTSNVPRTG